MKGRYRIFIPIFTFLRELQLCFPMRQKLKKSKATHTKRPGFISKNLLFSVIIQRRKKCCSKYRATGTRGLNSLWCLLFSNHARAICLYTLLRRLREQAAATRVQT